MTLTGDGGTPTREVHAVAPELWIEDVPESDKRQNEATEGEK